jgi:hypothetical protein
MPGGQRDSWKVYATDLAGNVHVTPAGKKLIVT